MNPIVRSILAVIVGMLVAFVLIACVEMVGIRVYPLPTGVDPTNLNAMKAAMATRPPAALLFVLLAYTVGSVAGGWVAARFAPSAGMMHAMIVAALLFGAGLMNLMTIPHPTWFWATSSVIYFLGAWSGARAGGASPPAAASA